MTHACIWHLDIIGFCDGLVQVWSLNNWVIYLFWITSFSYVATIYTIFLCGTGPISRSNVKTYIGTHYVGYVHYGGHGPHPHSKPTPTPIPPPPNFWNSYLWPPPSAHLTLAPRPFFVKSLHIYIYMNITDSLCRTNQDVSHPMLSVKVQGHKGKETLWNGSDLVSFAGECMEGMSWNLACWHFLVTFRTD